MNGAVQSGWCVYLLRDATGHVRYVGKGRPERVRSSAKKLGMLYEIAAVNLAEGMAFEIESRLIHLIGPERLKNKIVPPWPAHGDHVHVPDPTRPVSAKLEPFKVTPTELRLARESLGLTKYALAKLVGIQRGDLGAMEAGRRVIGPGMAARLREALERARQERAA